MDRRCTGDPGPGRGRRDLLRGAVALPLAFARGGTGAVLGADDVDPPARDGRRPPGLIGRQRDPENLESPFSALDTGRLLTPNEQFYVRTHFEVPELDT